MLEQYKPISSRIFLSETVGKDASGRKITKSAEYYNTPVGRLEIGEWKKRAEEAAAQDGLEDLLAKIKDHCKEHCAWLKNKGDLELYAIECLVSEAYKHWNDFDFEKLGQMMKRKDDEHQSRFKDFRLD